MNADGVGFKLVALVYVARSIGRIAKAVERIASRLEGNDTRDATPGIAIRPRDASNKHLVTLRA